MYHSCGVDPWCQSVAKVSVIVPVPMAVLSTTSLVNIYWSSKSWIKLGLLQCLSWDEIAFTALTLLVARQEEHLTCK